MKMGRAAAAALVLVTALVLTTAQAATINISADITTSQTWTADNEYILTQPIYVTNGATLTIEPGTVVRGEPTSGANDPGTLVVTRGSKLQSLGTARRPVVFTDLLDDNIADNLGTGAYGDRLSAQSVVGQWGGIVVLGYGYVANNTLAGPDPAREVQIEGLTAVGGAGLYGNCQAFLAGPYGRNCDDGDSGTIRYTRVSYGGFNLSANNEINGITLGGVGRETDIAYVEVFQTKDDSIEFFGGAANLKYAVLANHGDDGVDYDEGWRGKAQFVFQMQNVPGTEVTNMGGEWDGGNSPDGSQPRAIPTLCNMTFVGLGADKAGYANKDRNSGLHIRDNAGGRVYNSAFLDFGGATVGIEGGTGIAGSATAANSSGERAITPYAVDGVYYLEPASSFQLELTDNVFWKFGADPVLGNLLPTVGTCSITVATQCTQNTECPAGETCVNGPARWGYDAGKKHYDNGLFTNAALRNTKLTGADPLPIRQLTRFPSGNPSTPDPIDVIDPLPAPGGPLESTTNACPTAGGFLEAANFKGAFAPGRNWAEGWTLISRLGYLAPKPQVLVNADITTSQTWTPDNDYVLDRPIYVTSGATLTIRPGTVVRGEPTSGANDPGTLVVTRGSKIVADGTAEQPIVFTDLADDNVGAAYGSFPYSDKSGSQSVVGQWGGIVVLGYGYVANNTLAGPDPAREVQIEGLTAVGGAGLYGNCQAFLAGPYGRNCDDGDSGTMRYFRISYGGFNLSANNEINGLTLGGVGRNTTIERFEVYQTKDDAIEFFGGAANLKYAVLANHGDDGVDYDEGWRGKAQFVFQMQNVPGTEVTNMGGEWDGGNNPDGSQPRAIPTLYNMTFVGLGADKAGYANKDRNSGLHIRDNAGGRVYNSAFLDFGGATVGIEGGNGVAGSATAANSSGERAITPYAVDGVYYLEPASSFQLELTDNVFWKFGADPVLGNLLPTVGTCSITVATQCTQNTECPAGETCVNGPARWGYDAGKKHYDNGLFTNAALRNTKLTGADPLPIVALTRAPAGATSPDPIDVIDPRPASGGPLVTTANKAVAAGGFFEYAPYKGAFAPGQNWASGWTIASRLGYTGTCDPAAGVSVTPDEVGGVRFTTKSRMEWNQKPELFGYVFDVLRSTTASDFSSATCVKINDANADLTDAAVPASGQVFYYLVRAENSCGAGTLGFRSSGVERTGVSCP